MHTFHFGEETITAGIALNLARGQYHGKIKKEVQEKIDANRKIVEDIVETNQVVYGVTTGFGPLCTTLISPDQTKKLQHNLLISHSVGVGEMIPLELSKLMLILKLHSLALGFSGISYATIQRIQWHINNDCLPCVPEQGSVGASGDLAPLAHLFLPLIGLGQVLYKGRIMKTAEMFQETGLTPLELGPKEGLALINGTQFMTANAIWFLERFQNCLDNADIISAMNLEAMLGSVKAFDERLHALRPYPGIIYVAERMRMLIGESEIVASHKNCSRVQDPYSLRCIPQVHGASRNAFLHLKDVLNTEMNAVTDNPIIFDDHHAISGGNFHGQPLALPVDYAAFSAAELGNIADRRIFLSLMDNIEGLPKLLMKETGLNSGFMIPQYTTAALVTENKSLCFPASADSVPTSLGQEDHVSMGSVSVRKALKIIENLEKILGIELFCAAQGFDFRLPLKSGPVIDTCHSFVRTHIPHMDNDMEMYGFIEDAIQMIRKKELVNICNQVAKEQQINLKNEDHELFGIY